MSQFNLPNRCEHPIGDGCDLCCMACAFNSHFCSRCGGYTDHRGTLCIKRCELSDLAWRAKGFIRDPSQCKHEKDDGCMWCCMTCNLDKHLCPFCGTVSDHKESTCGEIPEDCYRRN